MTFPSKLKAKPWKHAICLKWPHLTPCLESSRFTSPTEVNFRVTHASGNAFSFFIAQLWHFRKSKPSQIPLLAPASIPCLLGPLELPLPSDPCCSSFLLFLRLSPFSDYFPTLNGNLSLEDSICHHYLYVKKKKYSGSQFSYNHSPFACNVLSFLTSIVSISLVNQMTY